MQTLRTVLRKLQVMAHLPQARMKTLRLREGEWLSQGHAGVGGRVWTGTQVSWGPGWALLLHTVQ